MVGGQILDLIAERGQFPGVETSENARETGQNSAFSGTSADSRMLPNSDLSVEHSSDRDSCGVEQLMQIHRMKTGALIRASLELGAAVVQVNTDIRQRLRSYGECCGLAFQIADDLLDVTGSRAKLGKKTGRDHELGKLTYPRLLGVEGSRRKATELVSEACECLSIFNERAEPLRQLARFIVERDH